VSVEIRVLGPGDETLLRRVAPDVFDDEVNPRLTAQWRPRTSARVSANDG
jgi:hypothetical protein